MSSSVRSAGAAAGAVDVSCEQRRCGCVAVAKRSTVQQCGRINCLLSWRLPRWWHSTGPLVLPLFRWLGSSTMRFGIGLPNPVPGCPGDLLPRWAAAADRRGFPTLATIDRVAFPNHDSLIALAAAAAVTERIELLPNILLLPTRDPVLLAKEAATVASISGGRLTLGVGIGGRPDDFAATGTEFSHRGRRTDEMLDTLIRAWRGEPVAGSPEPVVPEVPGGSIPILIGGMSDASVRRTLEYGVGWTAGGVPPDQVAPFAERVRAAWRDAGKDGEPRIVALTYFSLGDDVESASYQYLRHYYRFLGGYTEMIAAGALRSAAAIKDTAAKYADAGVDDLILDPTVAEISQVARLADIVM
jgi:alkanesulfonate monooxygenase SsuD/methylene tetrahydromethanopterin reductase-like flavin-dependent oxidoreductase (luciferase family)